jgi:XTP/dITP diphosphohydrolase
MRRLQRGDRLIVATHNPGTLVEIRELLEPYGVAASSAGELEISEPEETETTFAGNAQLKALHSARTARLPALADDSGIEVAALDGDPGVYSARWAGPSKDFAAAMARVEELLRGKGAIAPTQRIANFTCALCIAWPDNEAHIFEGKVFGTLVSPPRGSLGFGYDPMFLPDGDTRTYGEMPQTEKHATSHRARAFAKFVAECLA